MATRHYTFAVSIPANTAQTSPVEVDTHFDAGTVTAIRVITPGNVSTGIQIAIAHQPVIPRSPGQFIVSSNNSQNFPFTPHGQPSSGQWSVIGYNTTAGALVWNVYYDIGEDEDTETGMYEPHEPIRPELIYNVAPSAIREAKLATIT